MYKKVWGTFIIFAVVLPSSALAVNGDMGVGTDPNTNGSEAYPWLIEDLSDFDAFAGNNAYWAAGVHTKLMTDIDLADRTYTTAIIAPDTDTQTWWHQGAAFVGVFEGNNHVISHFIVNQPNISQIGVFGAIKTGGKVSNLNVTDVNIVGDDYIAGLAGHTLGATVENCSVSGTLRGLGYTAGGLVAGIYTSSLVSNCQSTVYIHSVGHTVGGLIGENDASSVVNCHSRSKVSGEWGNIGGLIGYNYYGTVSYSSSTSTVFKTDSYVDGVGGLVGHTSNGVISFCWSDSQVTGDSMVGGLIGGSSDIIAENSYSTGQVYGSSYVGGLVGIARFYSGSILTHCYSACSVNGDSNVAGILGGNHGISVNNCFWNTDRSQTNIAYFLYTGAPVYTYTPVYSMPIAEGKTTAEMMMLSTFTGAGWDFSETDGDGADWMMLREGEDYPRLAWQEVFEGDIAGIYGVDLADFAEIARNWLESGCPANCEDADIDESGAVELGDVAVVANEWMKQY